MLEYHWVFASVYLTLMFKINPKTVIKTQAVSVRNVIVGKWIGATQEILWQLYFEILAGSLTFAS